MLYWLTENIVPAKEFQELFDVNTIIYTSSSKLVNHYAYFGCLYKYYVKYEWQPVILLMLRHQHIFMPYVTYLFILPIMKRTRPFICVPRSFYNDWLTYIGTSRECVYLENRESVNRPGFEVTYSKRLNSESTYQYTYAGLAKRV